MNRSSFDKGSPGPQSSQYSPFFLKQRYHKNSTTQPTN